MRGQDPSTVEPSQPLPALDAVDGNRPPRAALFRAAGFPTIDAPALDDASLDALAAGLPLDVLDSPRALAERLRLARFDVLVLPYGSAFPVAAWPAIRAFLDHGGGLVVLGGAPLHAPVRALDGQWIAQTRQPSYAHALSIGPAERVRVGDRTCFELTVRFTSEKDFPAEDGTSGPRDAVLTPLATMKGDAVEACSALRIDWLHGPRAGARWVLFPSDAPIDVAAARAAVTDALALASAIDARPVQASVRAGERCEIRARNVVPRPRAGRPSPQLTLECDGRAIEGDTIDTTGFAPGLHRVQVNAGGAAVATTGFVVRDDALLARGPRLTVGRDFLRKDGAVFPIAGTTYMASDVHRKFLFEPNPRLWDADFAAMQAAGVNFVRTGLWTGWSRAMLDDGAIDDGVLRALDAFVQIAAAHGIVVCFDFFAFEPPAFGGVNPWLDPRALAGQRTFVTAIASRFRDCGWIHFDLINEPSYSPPDRLWTNLPIGDEFEKRAWIEFVRARHGDDLLVLRDRWRDASDDPLAMPTESDLTHAMVKQDRHPRKGLDFALFTNDVIARWAADLRRTIRAAAGDSALVTLGQDEGGTSTRPTQQLHAESVDYTSMHTWWNNDDLLWDAVVTKVPEKPSLIQETGIMRLEDEDGFPWRTPDEARALLERKLAYAVMSRGAGAVEWCWNVNPYQPIDNEAVIGLHRVDGTAKPELAALREFAEFFAAAAPWLDDFEPDPIVAVLPHTRTFLNRPGGLGAVKSVVRVLAENFGVVPTAISDQRLTAERLAAARLVLVPAPEFLPRDAAEALAAAAARGAHVVVSGFVEGDGYGEGRDRLVALGLASAGGPVPLAMHQSGDDSSGGLGSEFEDNARQWLRAAAPQDASAARPNIRLIPSPIEFSRDRSALFAALLSELEAARIPVHLRELPPIASRVLLTPRAALVACANEANEDIDGEVHVEIAGKDRALAVPVPAGRARLVLIERATGRVIAATPGAPITDAR